MQSTPHPSHTRKKLWSCLPAFLPPCPLLTAYQMLLNLPSQCLSGVSSPLPSPCFSTDSAGHHPHPISCLNNWNSFPYQVSLPSFPITLPMLTHLSFCSPKYQYEMGFDVSIFSLTILPQLPPTYKIKFIIFYMIIRASMTCTSCSALQKKCSFLSQSHQHRPAQRALSPGLLVDTQWDDSFLWL